MKGECVKKNSEPEGFAEKVLYLPEKKDTHIKNYNYGNQENA